MYDNKFIFFSIFSMQIFLFRCVIGKNVWPNSFLNTPIFFWPKEIIWTNFFLYLFIFFTLFGKRLFKLKIIFYCVSGSKTPEITDWQSTLSFVRLCMTLYDCVCVWLWMTYVWLWGGVKIEKQENLGHVPIGGGGG